MPEFFRPPAPADPGRSQVDADMAAVGRIEAVPHILEVVCLTTGLGFAAVARRTEHGWVVAAARDEIQFGLRPGSDLEVAATLVGDARDAGQAVAIDDAAADPACHDHPLPAEYGVRSFASAPIKLPDGRLFGTLCALDRRPARVNTPQALGMLRLSADLIAMHLDADARLAAERSARDAAAERLDRLRSVVDAAGDYAVITADRAGQIVEWNAGAEATFGFPAGQVVGRPIGTIFTDEDRAADVPGQEMEAAREHGVAEDRRWHRHADGRRVFVTGVMRPVRNAAGEFVGYVKVCRDQTDWHTTAESLARAAAIVESSDDAIVSKSLDGVIHTWNPGAERVFGYPAAEAVGRSIRMLLPADRPNEEDRILARLRAGERIDHFETVRVRKDGTHIDVSVTISPLRDAAGRVIGAAKIARDITDRKRAEADRARSAAELHKFKLLTDHAGDSLLLFDADGQIAYANRTASRLRGYPDGGLVGRSLADINAVFPIADYPALMARVRREGTVTVETVHRRVDGSTFPIEATTTYVELDGGRPYLLAVSRDVSDRKRAEADRRRADADRDRLTEQRRLALDAADLGWWHLDPASGDVIWDERFRAIFGVTGDRLDYAAVIGLLHPDDRARVDAAVQAATRADDPRPYDIDYRVVHPDGATRWVRAKGRAYHAGTGADRRYTSFVGTVQDVTAERAAHDALRDLADRLERQSRLFEQIATTTPDFIYVFDRQWRFLYANRRLLEVWGLTAEQALGKGLLQLGYPQWHADMHHRELDQVMRTKRPVKGEVPFTGGSGISGVYEYIFTPVLGPDGDVEVVAGTTRDVTERRQAEGRARAAQAATEDSLARWRAVVANMAEGVIVADPAGHLLEWNWAALDMHGYASIDDARGQLSALVGTFDLRLPDGTPIPFEQWPISRLIRGESFRNWEVCVRRTDRAARGQHAAAQNISYSGSPVRDRDGNVTLVLLTLHDVTQERRAQRAVGESEARFREMFEQTPIGMTVNELDGRYVHVNPAYCRMTGYTRDELLDPAFDARHLTHPDDRPTVAERYHALVTGQIPAFYLEKRYVRRDGSAVWVRVTATARRDPDGRPVQFIRLVEDVSDRKRAEAEREQLLSAEQSARAEAERQGRIKDEFLATLSHELRTPLNAIVGWTQILKGSNTGAAAGGGDDDDLAEGLSVIDRNARAQTQIIEDILDMSRITSGKLRLDVQRVDLAALVRAGVDTVQPAADAKAVRLQVLLDPTAGPVSGDPGRLHQVFWNLLSNAVKFTPKGGRVQVLLERVNSHVEVGVTDTGEGIAADFLPFVFDRFRQADASTTRKHGGLGLELSIVKQLVELHGGRVRVKSPGPGRGSTFTVELPLLVLHAPHPDQDEPAAAREHPTTEVPVDAYRVACDQLEGVTVVAVDDEPDGRSMVERLLSDCGAAVRTAGSAAEALALIRADPPDVLVSDIGMPGEDGYALIRQVRALPPDAGGRVRAVALTAYARAADRVRALEAGFHMHLAKPVEPTELVVTVASLAKLG